jgi:hypothetical protein
MSAILPIPGMLLSNSLPSIGVPPASTPTTSPAATSPNVGNYVSALASKGSGGGETLFTILRPARIATFLVGLLLIAAGIFALKPVRDVAVSAARTARRVSEAAAAT